MTKAEFWTICAEQVRLNAGDPTEQNRILMWGHLVSRRLARNWFWEDLSYDISITLVDGQRVYPLSDVTTDIDGTSIECGFPDFDSFGVDGNSLDYRDRQWLDDRDRGWRLSTNTGASRVFTWQRRSIVLEKVPTSEEAGTVITGRVSIVPASPKAISGANDSLEDGTASTPGWPEELQELIVSGVIGWGGRRQGAQDWTTLYQLWKEEVDEFHSQDTQVGDYDAVSDLPINMQGFGRVG